MDWYKNKPRRIVNQSMTVFILSYKICLEIYWCILNSEFYVMYRISIHSMWQITTKHFMFFHSQYVADHHPTLHVFPLTVCGRSPPNTSCFSIDSMWQITTKHFMFFHSQYVADHHQTLHVFPFTVCGRSPPSTSCFTYTNVYNPNIFLRLKITDRNENHWLVMVQETSHIV